MKKVKIWLKSGNVVEFETEKGANEIRNKIYFSTENSEFIFDSNSIEAIQKQEIQPLTKL